MRDEQVKVIKQTFILLYPKMMSVASRYVDEFTAKDLIQEVFLLYYERYYEIKAENKHAYLMRTLQNKCLNYLKHRNIEENYETEIALAEARTAFLSERSDQNEIYDRLDKEDLRRRLEISINKLTPKCQQAFRLHFFEELTYREVGEAMNISHRTAEVHVQQALAFLKSDVKNLSFILFIFLSLK